MKPLVLKILILSIILLSVYFISCSDNYIINIYNKYTEHYRSDGVEQASDTGVTVKVLGSITGMPIVNSRVVLTKPANDTIAALTNKEGYAVFKVDTLREGSYSVKASVLLNGAEYSRVNTFYLYEKNNLVLVVYIKEN